MLASSGPWSIVSAVGATVATATVAYLTRQRRLPRLGFFLAGRARGAAGWAWGNTRVLFVVAILAGYAWNAYQTNEIKHLAMVNRVALCLFYAPLQGAIATDKFKVSHPGLYGLSPVAVKSLELKLRQYKNAVVVLGELRCAS